MQTFNPYRMYKVNIALIVIHLLLALGFYLFAGPLAPFAQVFLSACFFFVIGALANLWMIRIIENESNKSQK